MIETAGPVNDHPEQTKHNLEFPSSTRTTIINTVWVCGVPLTLFKEHKVCLNLHFICSTEITCDVITQEAVGHLSDKHDCWTAAPF